MKDKINSILKGENKHIEFKEKYSKSLLKTISAYANYHDGMIIIGINNDGKIIGCTNIIQLRLNIENAINDNIKPRPYYEIEVAEFEEREILILKISKGENTPYVYDKKAYQRFDTSTIEVDKIQYDELVLLGKNITYEELDYGSTGLNFELLEKSLKESLDIRYVDNNILKSLELYRHDSYNNAAALLADTNNYNEIGIDLICYQDKSMLEIKDRIQIKGCSIIKHYEQSMQFYRKHINTRDIIKSERRVTFEEVPLVAYREAIANAIIHRDYSKKGHNRIEFFEDSIEIVSIGGLPIGISEEEFVKGSFTNARNRIIMEFFLRIKFIEKLGTGIRRIKSIYSQYHENPKFEVMKNSIKITLPKINSEKIDEKNRASNVLSLEEEKVLNYIKSCTEITRKDVENYMLIKKTKATQLLNNLVDKKLIYRLGSGRGIKYYLKI